MTGIGRRTVRLEHRLTRPNATLRELDEALALAAVHGMAAITVNPWLVKAARRSMGRSGMRLGTVIGYPHGGQVLAVKAFEASKALEQGANQIDFVMNGGALASREEEVVVNDMLAVVEMAHSALATAGVIIEAEPMDDELIRRACRLAERAGADHVVTSTGDASARGAARRVALMRDSVGPRMAIKASARFRAIGDLRSAAAAGATWISAPFTTGLAEAAANRFGPTELPSSPPPRRSAFPAARPQIASRAG